MISAPAVRQETILLLLVDDSQADVFLMETCLEEAQLPVSLTLAEDGVMALDALGLALEQHQLPDLMLLDLNMPRRNGFEVLAAMQADSRYQGVPVVVLTSSTAAVDRQQALALGAKAFVTKPNGLIEVTRMLERAVAAAQGQENWETLG